MVKSLERRRVALVKGPKHLRERYQMEEVIHDRAWDLYERFRDAGCTWAACVQAVKTDQVPMLMNKWADRSRSEAARDRRQIRQTRGR